MDKKIIQNKLKVIYTLIIVLTGLVAHFVAEEFKIDTSQQSGAFDRIYSVVLGFIGETGHFLAAVVSVHLIYDLFLKKEENEIIAEQFYGQLSILKDEILPNMMEYGLSKIHKFKLSKLLENLEEGDEILWLDTYCPEINRIRNELVNALSRGVKVKILTININSNTAKQRFKEIEGEIQENFTLFKQQADVYQGCLAKILGNHDEGYRKNLEVRFYEDLLGVPIYIHIKNSKPIVGYTGWYLNSSASNYLYFKWLPSVEPVLENLEKYFRKKWVRNEQNLMDEDYLPEYLDKE